MGKKNAASLDAKDWLGLYEKMLLVRRFEEKAGQLYGMGLIGGFCHLYIGQEAVVVGCHAAMKKGDTMVTSYRDHGHLIIGGMDPKYAMAELLGRETGCSKGKGGSMHMFDTANGFYGGHGIVGAQVPIGTGLAFAHKYQGKDSASLTFFGDGAAHQGQVYESFNMAALWKLPVLYIIENNEYAMGTSVARASSVQKLAVRGESFNIPGIQVDGMDVFAVHEAVSEALAKIRAGEGPQLIEMKTYRYRGHSMSDPAKYRTKEEVTEVKETHDPITRLKDKILKEKVASEDDLKKLEKAVKDEVAASVEFAKESPEPDASELWTDVYNKEA